jgi:hypothetical protein
LDASGAAARIRRVLVNSVSRVATAGVIGANIGAVMVGVPVVVILVVTAIRTIRVDAHRDVA